MRYLKLTALTIAGTLLAIYLGTSVVVAVKQDALVFPSPASYSRQTPTALGLSFEDLRIPVNPSEHIHAWYIPALIANHKVILFLHGNGYTIGEEVEGEIGALRQTGASLLVVDYRGYGDSSPVQANGTRACEDARAAMSYLLEQRHVPAQDVFIVGRSIGTGVGAQLAVENPHAAGLVLLSPFTDLYAVARQDKTMRWLPLELMGSRNKLDTLGKISSIHMPLLLVVGADDTLTPAWMAQTLYQHANQPKLISIVAGAGHNDLWETGGRDLAAKISDFVNSRSK
jgi:pimeloyl-ACP methyl ester carboxylesterase